MSLYFKIDNLPEHLRAQAERQLSRSGSINFKAPKQEPSPSKKRNPNIRVKHSDNLPSASPFHPSSSFSNPAPSKGSLSPHSPLTFSPVPSRNLRSSKMSKTEQEFQSQVLHGAGRFEAITLVLEGGSRYTPDFLVLMDGLPTLVEVKGSYRLQSEGRAHTAFLEAASQFSSIFQFVWVSKNKDKSWDIKAFHKLPQDADPDSPSDSLAKEVL